MGVGQGPTSFGVADNAGAALSLATSTVPSEANSTGGTRSTLSTNQTSAVATSNRTAESTLLSRNGSRGVKRSDSCRKLYNFYASPSA